jgi:hypothetical protein
MVSSVDNRSRLRGVVAGRAPHPSLAEFDVLEVDVDETSRVDERPDLLASTVGSRVLVTVDRSLLDQAVRPGVRIVCVVRRTPDGAMADRDPGSVRLITP